MADIELEVLSRAIMLGKVDALIAAEIEPRHFFDPDTRAVFETVAEHFRVWRNSLSLDGVRRRHPDYKIVPTTDELDYLIQEFSYDRVLKIAITAAMDINRDLERAETGDRDVLTRIPEIMMDHVRQVLAMAPGVRAARFSDMAQRVDTIRRQQAAGITMGIKSGIPAIEDYIGDIRVGEFFVHCGYSGRGKTQSMARSAIHAYRQGDRVLFMPLEMSADEILELFDAEAGRLSRMALRKRQLAQEDYGRYEEAAARVSQAGNDIIVVDRAALRGEPTVDKLAALIERHGTQTNCVDYVSLVQAQTRKGSDWERVAEVSRDLKALAGAMGVRIYAAAQNRRDAALDGPTEDNIAFSNTIYQDCNVMVGYHQTPDMARMNQVQGRLIKNRGGDKGPPGGSGYFEFYEHWDRDRMIMEPWTDQHKWMAGARAGDGA